MVGPARDLGLRRRIVQGACSTKLCHDIEYRVHVYHHHRLNNV